MFQYILPLFTVFGIDTQCFAGINGVEQYFADYSMYKSSSLVYRSMLGRSGRTSFSAWFVNGTTLYAKAQIAASAANRLKFQDPAYYQALYKENIEMLYFLIEPQMSEIIYQINSGDNNEEKIGDALYEILRK